MDRFVDPLATVALEVLGTASPYLGHEIET